jgi:LEA14-like dessication related protein
MSIPAKAFADRLSLRVLVLMLPFVAACTMVRPLPPEVSLLNLEVTALSLSHATLSADLQVFNPNGIAVTLKEVDYVLRLNDVVVSKGQSMEKVRIGAGEYGVATLRLSSAYYDLWRVLKQASKDEDVEFDLKGLVKVGGLGVLNKTFRFDRAGSIPLEQIKP